MEISFCDLRAKVVVNLFDGKQLGHIIDMIIDTSCSRVLGLVLPCEKNIFSFFKSGGNVFVPYNRICKIGKDVILVDLNISNQQNIRILEENKKNKKNPTNQQLGRKINSDYNSNTFNTENDESLYNNFENSYSNNSNKTYDYYDEININKRKEDFN